MDHGPIVPCVWLCHAHGSLPALVPCVWLCHADGRSVAVPWNGITLDEIDILYLDLARLGRFLYYYKLLFCPHGLAKLFRKTTYTIMHLLVTHSYAYVLGANEPHIYHKPLLLTICSCLRNNFHVRKNYSRFALPQQHYPMYRMFHHRSVGGTHSPIILYKSVVAPWTVIIEHHKVVQ